jgi:hypothetical protein
MGSDTEDKTFIFSTAVNSFHYLYSDAEYMLKVIRSLDESSDFETVRLSRSAILLYVFSLEALINRVLATFLPEKLQDFFIEKEDRFSLADKWQLLPLITDTDPETAFDTSSYPWGHFVELIKLRNDYIHPKHDRRAFYKVITSHRFTPLSWREIPPDLGVSENSVIYRQTQIPRDPYAIRPSHVETTKKVVDDMIELLDKFLQGKLTDEDWLHSDQFKLVYPEGASFADLPPDPHPSGPPLPTMPSSDIGL